MTEYYKCKQCNSIVKIIQKGQGQLSCCDKKMNRISNFSSVNDVIDFAIEKEEEAFSFYNDWADKVEQAWIRDVFKEFAGEEQKHKNLLEEVKKGKSLQHNEKSIVDLKISDYLIDLSPTPDMDYKHALIIAMKREKASFKLYSDLANTVNSDTLRSTLIALAQEEARHKLRLETLYDTHFLSWD
jgi:desulfoferrodoxin-like iron-binding protein